MRYLPHTPEDITAMLAQIGVESLDALFATIPKDCCCRLDMKLPLAMTEWELNDHMDAWRPAWPYHRTTRCSMGAGSYDHFVPAAARYASEPAANS